MSHIEVLIEGELAGYRGIQKKERAIARSVVSEHGELVRLWLRLLDQYSIGVKGTHMLEDADENQRILQVVRWQLFALAIGHSKAALDATVAGNYHHACFSIRYMAEVLTHAIYVRLRPTEARRWYKDLALPYTASVPPKFETAFKAIRPEYAGRAHLVQPLYDIATDMDTRGAHPSQTALLQTLKQSGDRATVGPRYDREHTVATLDPGLFLTLVLLEEIDSVVPAEQWRGQMESLWTERRVLMAPYWHQLDPSASSAMVRSTRS